MAAKNIVITGAVRGVGYAMALLHLELGDNLVITGRDENSVKQSVASLQSKGVGVSGFGRVFGTACEVTDEKSMQNLMAFALSVFPEKRSDAVVLNAGVSQQHAYLWDTPTQVLDEVIRTNVFGTLLGLKVAINAFSQLVEGMCLSLKEQGQPE